MRRCDAVGAAARGPIAAGSRLLATRPTIRLGLLGLRCGAVVVGALLGQHAWSAQQPPPVAAPTDSDRTLPDLARVPVPLLDAFEPSTRRQLEDARATAGKLIAGADQRALEAFGALCLLYLRYELLDAAEPCLRETRALAPRDFRWPYYLTHLYTRNADLERARESIESTLELAPGDLPALLRAGEVYLLMGDVARAQTSYAAALAADPSSDAARFGLGRVAAARGDHTAAVSYFEAALRGQPAGSLIHHHLGMSYRALGDLDRARAELGKSRRVEIAFRDPLMQQVQALSTSRESIFNAGIEHLRQGDARGAQEAFRRVVELDPGDAQARYNLARAAIELGDLAAAETELRRAIEIWPDFFDAHVNLAILLGRTGRDQEAGEHLERAIALDPEHLPARVLWARLLAGRGDAERAIAELEEVVRLDPSAAEAHLALGMMRSEAGDFDTARRHLERASELVPDDPRPRVELVGTLIQAGSYRAARAALDAGRARWPEDLALMHLEARLLATCPDAEVRDGARAVRLAEAVVERQLSVDHVETLAMAYAEVGRFDDALLWQRRVLERQAATGEATSASEARLAMYQRREPVRAAGIDAGGTPPSRSTAEP